MKQKLLYIGIAVSILCNIVFMVVFISEKISFGGNEANDNQPIQLDPMADPVQRKALAEKAVKKLVCDNLYYPNTYDPVKTEVDSAFYGYMLDPDCINAAVELIDLRSKYESAKSTYDEKANDVKVFGGSGVFRHLRVERDDAAAEMKELKPKIEKYESIIKNRDDSKDGKFVGWVITHRYRAANSNNVVSFGEVLYVLDQQMNENYIVRYSLDEKDKKNLENVRKVIEDLLGISNN